MQTQPVRIISKPGIKRDGTRLDGEYYVDGQWVRFDRGLPRKMAGYRSINEYLTGPVREIDAYTLNDTVYVHTGSATKIERLTVDASLNTSIVSDRTPVALTADANNLWQFAVDHEVTTGNPLLIAQVAPNLTEIANNAGGQLFTGDLFGTGVLVPVTPPAGSYSFTGGVMALDPYTVAFGSKGYVAWSVPGNPTDYAGAGAGNAFVTHQKIIAGMPLRGGGAGQAGLLWSLDTLMRMTYVGGTGTFVFDTISGQSSILSQNSVIEYDGVFYWAGIDRFLMFNGVVREIENTLNRNFFFDNLNWAYRQKVFVTKVPRWGEIWWCFPSGDSTEPNHAVIYNVRENTWYDTPLPGTGRSAGVFPSVFRYAAMTGVEPQSYAATAAAVAAGGAGYTLGDNLTVSGGVGAITTKLQVTGIAAGAVTAVAITDVGEYVTAPTNPVAVTGGTGAGATFTMTYVAPYRLWVHEIGVDEVDGLATRPIESFFETGDISLPVQSSTDKVTRAIQLEPDFVQTGDMQVQVVGRANSRAPEVDGDQMTFPDTASTPEEEVVYLKDQRREMRFRFISNTVGGDFQMGTVLAHLGPGDGTVIG